MQNKVQEGNILNLVAPYAVSSGGGFQVGDIFAVAEVDAAVDDTLAGAVVGVFSLNKKTGDAVTAQGVKLYWDDTNKEVTITASTNKFIGHSVLSALGADTTVQVRLVPN